MYVCVYVCMCVCMYVCVCMNVCMYCLFDLLGMLHYKAVTLHASLYFCCRACSDQHGQCIPFTFAFTLSWIHFTFTFILI